MESLTNTEIWAILCTQSGGVPDSTGWMRQGLHAEDDPLASLISGSKTITANEEFALAA